MFIYADLIYKYKCELKYLNIYLYYASPIVFMEQQGQ